ncbi:MAG: outer membrane beta-barrel protein [Acidobacteriota bacterium]|nr:outer membrane beta-barrel protein [Acidobacteriota bacterium]
MKKILTLLVVMFLSTLFASGEGFRLEGSMGYYSIADSIFKDTYGSGNLMYGGSLSHDLWRNFELRGEVGYFKDRGETTLTKEEIKFSIIPVVIGVRVKLIEIKKLNLYLGAGVDIYSFKESAPIGDTSDSTTGYHVEGGSYIALGQRFYIDLNLRYIKADARPYDETIKLGGHRVGIGVGYSF